MSVAELLNDRQPHFLCIVDDRLGSSQLTTSRSSSRPLYSISSTAQNEALCYACRSVIRFPVLQSLLEDTDSVVTAGDHDGMGPTRREELKRSCARLGIEADRCEALDSL